MTFRNHSPASSGPGRVHAWRVDESDPATWGSILWRLEGRHLLHAARQHGGGLPLMAVLVVANNSVTCSPRRPLRSAPAPTSGEQLNSCSRLWSSEATASWRCPIRGVAKSLGKMYGPSSPALRAPVSSCLSSNWSPPCSRFFHEPYALHGELIALKARPGALCSVNLRRAHKLRLICTSSSSR